MSEPAIPGYIDPFPGQYVAPDGVESSLPGADVTALQDPSATTIAAAVANAYAQMNAYEATTAGQGSQIGVPIDLPSAQSPD
jgi:hypothetical protein